MLILIAFLLIILIMRTQWVQKRMFHVQDDLCEKRLRKVEQQCKAICSLTVKYYREHGERLEAIMRLLQKCNACSACGSCSEKEKNGIRSA